MVDADAHVNEDPFSWNELADLHPGWLSAGKSAGEWVAQIGDKLYPTQEGPGRGVPIDSATNPACAAGAADLDQRLADMDSEGIDIQVLYGGLIIGLTSYDDAGFALDVARAYNDWLVAKVCGHNPWRLKGVAVVPLQDVDRSILEVTRVARLGAVGVAIPPVLGALNLDDASLQPFFECCASLDLAVAVHSAPGMNLELPGRRDASTTTRKCTACRSRSTRWWRSPRWQWAACSIDSRHCELRSSNRAPDGCRTSCTACTSTSRSGRSCCPR